MRFLFFAGGIFFGLMSPLAFTQSTSAYVYNSAGLSSEYNNTLKLPTSLNNFYNNSQIVVLPPNSPTYPVERGGVFSNNSTYGLELNASPTSGEYTDYLGAQSWQQLLNANQDWMATVQVKLSYLSGFSPTPYPAPFSFYDCGLCVAKYVANSYPLTLANRFNILFYNGSTELTQNGVNSSLYCNDANYSANPTSETNVTRTITSGWLKVSYESSNEFVSTSYSLDGFNYIPLQTYNLKKSWNLAPSDAFVISLTGAAYFDSGVISNGMMCLSNLTITPLSFPVIKKSKQTISFPAIGAKTYGNSPFLLAATSSSGLPVAYTSSAPAVARITSNSVTIVGAGTTTITASQAGSPYYNAAANVSEVLTVGKSSQSVTFTPLTPITFVKNGTFALSATCTSMGTVTFTSSKDSVLTISGKTATMKSKGTVSVTATAPATVNYKSASTTSSITLK